MLINKTRHFIGTSNYIFLPLPLNKIKKLFCPHGLSMWQKYCVYMYKYFEKIPLMLTKKFIAHAHKFMIHVHAFTWVGSQLKEPKYLLTIRFLCTLPTLNMYHI